VASDRQVETAAVEGDTPDEAGVRARDVHDDDELAVALENEVSLLTASLPIIRPETLFTPVRPPAAAYEPATDAERAIAEQAESGDTLAAIERLEALIAGRRAEAGGAPPRSGSADEQREIEAVAQPGRPDDDAVVGEVSRESSEPREHSGSHEPSEPREPPESTESDERGPSSAASASELVVPEAELDADVRDDADDVASAEPGLAPIATPRMRANQGVLTAGRPEPMPVFSIEQPGMEPTSLQYRVGRATRLFWLWFAASASVLVVGLGALLAGAGLNLLQVVIAAALGVALSFLPLGLSSLTGVWSGLPTVIVSRAVFGVVGNTVPAVLILVVRLFWGAALLWLLSVTVADSAVAAGWTTDRALVLWATFGVAAFVAIAVALTGYALVAVVQLIATIATGVLGFAIIVAAWPATGWDLVASGPFGQWILVVEGAVLVFSILGLAWASAGGDLARYQRPGTGGTATALWSGFGASLPMFALIVFGALVAWAQPSRAAGLSADPVRLLASVTPQWFAVPVVAAIVVGLVPALVVTLYSGGFAVQAVGIHLPRWASVLALGMVAAAAGGGLVIAVPDVRSLLLAYPTTLAVPVAAWAGIFLGDFLRRRRRLATDSLLHRGGVYPDWRWVNLIALVAITVIGLGFMRADAPGLGWEGYLYRLIGVGTGDALGRSDIGVLVALALGLVVGVCAAWRAVPAQEAASR
jgi:purine-cytosine permease-like protein